MIGGFRSVLCFFQGLYILIMDRMRLKIEITTVYLLILLPPLSTQSILNWKILDLAPMLACDCGSRTFFIMNFSNFLR